VVAIVTDRFDGDIARRWNMVTNFGKIADPIADKALTGAAFIGLLPEISASAPLVGSSHGQDVVFGLIVILVMLLLPNGVAGLLRRFEPRVKTAIKSDPRAS
jgi:phosphatidylglycerophosphate synthase